MNITLCGSTRFIEQFKAWNLWLSLRGHAVYSVATSVKGDFEPNTAQKIVLDLVHLKKISNSNEILVIDIPRSPDMHLKHFMEQNPGYEPYIGFSTAREIAWASMENKRVSYISEMVELIPNYNRTWVQAETEVMQALSKGS